MTTENLHEIRAAALGVAAHASLLLSDCAAVDHERLVTPEAAPRGLVKRIAEFIKLLETLTKPEKGLDSGPKQV